ncbi:MAG: hypothetical protein DKM50_13310 [Candidatus Margulisiibacteriota bacterium]|nr:MAG: hypothetical protein A2X43_13565 [Candidatus Margulisbacteria bacterium GWD2_39_127]OGI05334.1 MAG: hypothetical protein A2X42_05775 [Candidatus Margulisbacteria bacterium GWF2_38_17]OGI06041.1 MAG: hypothetical protein A2X41_06260 [Candidatus Margulisbacteria bacterium GWE2_39_32]PZM77319.1 MAG: hypothetical protein DKM50_13310 [Candidatus Margulisiibacteriota bacterium]HAR62565.1 hypothetical protein [Candidatus Margulisiibacteriota bacterium]
MKTQTPKGVRDLLPDDVDSRGDVVSTLRNIFKANGYRRIITPTFELNSVLKLGMASRLQKMSITFPDHNGNLMVLRPDMTTPIARVVGTRMGQQPKPIKLFYSANVYRQQKPEAGRELEFYQAGVELFGQNGVDVDAQIIALAVECLKAVGLKNFLIDIGHMGLINNLPPSKLEAFEKQDYVTLGDIPLRGTHEVIEKFPYFCELYEELKKLGVEEEHICFNLGLVKEIGYYTGVVFDIIDKGVGYFIGSGGRYDSLVGCYGDDCPAIGFAFGVERLLLSLEVERENRS